MLRNFKIGFVLIGSIFNCSGAIYRTKSR